MDNNLTSPQHPYPWAHPSALATAVQPAHPSEIPTISNGPIIGWPVSHGTLSTSAVCYRRTNTLKGLIICYRALLDFIYLAQDPTHDASTRQYLIKALHKFHTTKHILLELGV